MVSQSHVGVIVVGTAVQVVQKLIFKGSEPVGQAVDIFTLLSNSALEFCNRDKQVLLKSNSNSRHKLKYKNMNTIRTHNRQGNASEVFLSDV